LEPSVVEKVKGLLKPKVAPPPPPKEEVKPPAKVKISEGITVNELATKLNVRVGELVKKLFAQKINITSINQRLSVETSTKIAKSLGCEVEVVRYGEEIGAGEEVASHLLVPRAPVVTLMGHVDHGKTTLLDALRESNIVGRESGGITQHIGAYKLKTSRGEVVFLDTPGHESFTAMRARGAQVTDLVVLVVAADDGVMPQTVEAINHARAAKVPIIVAINKIDLPSADPDRVKQDLNQYGLTPEEWGGKTIFVEISAREKVGLDDLLEAIELEAEMLEIKGVPSGPAEGIVIEAKLDPARGPIATVLVRKGLLKRGDSFIAGLVYGKVKAMIDDWGNMVTSAAPATPIEILGFNRVPEVGDKFQVVPDELQARRISEVRRLVHHEEKLAHRHVTLATLREEMRAGRVKQFNIIIKADVSGSVEVVSDSLKRLTREEINLQIIHSGVGTVTRSDVLLAAASNAVIIGFHVQPSQEILRFAQSEKVEIRTYRVIYELIDEMKKSLEGLLEPEYKEVYLGRAVLRRLFKISSVGTIAGCYVEDGKVTSTSKIKVIRNDMVVRETVISSLKHFKDSVKEVKKGFECGIKLENFDDLKPGDILEAFIVEEIPRKLNPAPLKL